ncbi:protein STRUBBELIG-RECEPTOR FAMILY 3 isoform X2 [Neltuma alba]|uniref:protein STRUBBELIG-RECEPTOR FAMILY 3 isoform X2 n=1 Tax=Neltuma alba TaxID=207710 RepID=UPI0010A56442|nr:protein STRUBBELIG-RECEPTOR FAMILY 3-like isoform X2 [Prosopis alba]
MGLHVRIFVLLMIAFTGTFCTGDTDLLDAINSLYVALGSPPLQGWKTTGGDPCAELWQGVACVFSNITQLSLRGMNLGGELGSNLNFPSIIEIDLSNNHIGGPIPSTLPLTLRNLSLSSNQLNGSIPDALSSLTQLSDLSLSNNLLDGQIPDVFQQLTGLINIDLSANKLSGQLPLSLGNLSLLSTLHLQNNELSGFLNVLQDLPLQDLNIENNLFFGPIPPQLLSIPNLRKDGNPFNTTVIRSPPAAAPGPLAMVPSPAEASWNVANSPFTLVAAIPASARKYFVSKNVIWIVIAGFLVFIALGVCLFILWCFKKRPENKNAQKSDVGLGPVSLHKHQYSDPLEKASLKPIRSLGYGEQNRRTNMTPDVQNEQEIYMNRVSASSKLATLQPPPSNLPINLGEEDLTKPVMPTKVTERHVMTSSLHVYTIASLQQYTNSFSQENYIGEGTLGVIYRAELPDGKLSGRLLTANGYGASEFETGSYTKQSDVFSFGVVMLELLTGRKSCDRSRSRGEQFLVRWAVPQLHDIDALTKMVDPSLNGAYSMKSLSRFADIISSCLQREPEFRPAMTEVVQDLLRMI